MAAPPLVATVSTFSTPLVLVEQPASGGPQDGGERRGGGANGVSSMTWCFLSMVGDAVGSADSFESGGEAPHDEALHQEVGDEDRDHRDDQGGEDHRPVRAVEADEGVDRERRGWVRCR